MENIEQVRTMSAHTVLDGGMLDGKALYMYCNNAIPSEIYFANIDGEKSYKAIIEKFGSRVKAEHTYRYIGSRQKKVRFNETYLVMDNGCVVEFDTGYCDIFHNGKQEAFIKECSEIFRGFKARQRREELEINIIVKGKNGLELRAMEINRTKLDLDLFYEEDFKEVDAVICKRLNRQKDKGMYSMNLIEHDIFLQSGKYYSHLPKARDSGQYDYKTVVVF